MSMFQKSVLLKHLKSVDEEKMQNAHKRLSTFLSKKENILTAKEENYQYGFLEDIFVQVLDFTLNPSPNYNLTTEFKNETDSKKADGAILDNEQNAIGVIELKSTKTKELKSIEQQAFNYKNHNTFCKYVITSNFEKLRFYIDDATVYEEFNLFELESDYERFKIFYLLLQKDNILKNLPALLKEESKFHEKEVSDKLYNDYFTFKKSIFNNLVENNSDIDPLLLLKKSQKLLDRFIFIFFAEDRGLLPPNMITKVIEENKKLAEMGRVEPLYKTFQIYFNYIDAGNAEHEIPKYNGELFKPDSLLDSLNIEDTVLTQGTSVLTEYDFDTELDVNVLGHIFENSLSDIEEMQAKIKGEDFDKKQGKRKKDGVFYTPKYITKYIVENTVGKLCEQKKAELEIQEIEFNPDIHLKKGNKDKVISVKGNKLLEKLKDYQNYLLGLKILDPACGSGAFLNEALDFLIAEHNWVDEIGKELDPLFHIEIEKSILENNLYGVDINEEAVEIAKLSLWLRTANRNRTLNNLSNTLKCGNSLIDELEVAGELAFDWNKEFPEVMAKGGFDVVIGNPPYIQLQKMGEESEKLKMQNFKTFEKTGDIYCLFYELGNKLLKIDGFLGYITSNKWMRANYGKSLRAFFSKEVCPKVLIDLGSNIFEDATVDSNIFIYQNSKTEKHLLNAYNLSQEKKVDLLSSIDSKKVMIEDLSEAAWTISNPLEMKLKQKIERLGKPLKDWDIDIYRGVLTGYNEAFIIDTKTKEKLCKEDPKSEEIIKPILRGRDINRYSYDWAGLWLIFIPWHFPLHEDQSIAGVSERAEKEFEKNYPAIYKHFSFYKENLSSRNKAETGIRYEWYVLQRCAATYYEEFKKEKIIWSDIATRPIFTHLDKEIFFNNTVYMIISQNPKFLLSILNSAIIKWYFPLISSGLGEKAQRFFKIFVEILPIPSIDKDLADKQEKLIDFMLSLNTEFQKRKNKFLNRVSSLISQKTEIEEPKLSNKLKSFYELSFTDFVKELKKQKTSLSLKEQDDWEDYFKDYKAELLNLQSQIDKTDCEIDQMVYKLYDLSEEEIKIVEESSAF